MRSSIVRISKKAEEYLIDFGLRHVSNDGQLLFMRGTGPAPYCYVVQKADKPRFVGLGLEVETRADLEALSKLPGASAIENDDLAGRRRARAPDRPVRLPRRRDFRSVGSARTAASAALAAQFGRCAGARQRNPATADRPAGRDPPRACRARGRRLPGDLRVVHAAFRLHPERRAGASRRLAGGRLHAARSRRHADRPPHAGARAGLRAGLQPHRLRARRCGRRRHRPSRPARAGMEARLGHRATHSRQPDLRLLGGPLGRQARALLRRRSLHRRPADRRASGEPRRRWRSGARRCRASFTRPKPTRVEREGARSRPADAARTST